MITRTKIKLSISIVIIGILVAFIFLNREIITINLIIGKVETSRATLVIVVLALGFILGWLAHSFLQVKKPKLEFSKQKT